MTAPAEARLTLKESRAFENGVVLLVYGSD